MEAGGANTATGTQAPRVINNLFITQKIIFLTLIFFGYSKNNNTHNTNNTIFNSKNISNINNNIFFILKV